MYCTHFRLWRRQGVGRLSPCSICCPLFSDALPLLSAGSADYMIWPWENLCLLFTTYIYPVDGFARSRVNALIRGHWRSFQGLQNYRSGTQNIINISECFRSCCDTPSLVSCQFISKFMFAAELLNWELPPGCYDCFLALVRMRIQLMPLRPTGNCTLLSSTKVFGRGLRGLRSTGHEFQ